MGHQGKSGLFRLPATFFILFLIPMASYAGNRGLFGRSPASLSNSQFVPQFSQFGAQNFQGVDQGNNQFVPNQNYGQFFGGQEGAELSAILGLNQGNLGFGQNNHGNYGGYGGQGNQGSNGGTVFNPFDDSSFGGSTGQAPLTPWERLLVYGDESNGSHGAPGNPGGEAPGNPSSGLRGQGNDGSGAVTSPRSTVQPPSPGTAVATELEENNFVGSDGRTIHYRAFVPRADQRNRCQKWGVLPFFDGDSQPYLQRDQFGRTGFDWAVASVALSHCQIPIALFAPTVGTFDTGAATTWWNAKDQNGVANDTNARSVDELLRKVMFNRSWIDPNLTTPVGLSGGSTMVASSLLKRFGQGVKGAVLFCGSIRPSALSSEAPSSNVPVFFVHGQTDFLRNDGLVAAEELRRQGFDTRPEVIQGGHCDYPFGSLLDQRLTQILGNAAPVI